MEKKIKSVVEEILKLLEITTTEIKVEKDEADYYHVEIQTPETGLLIGYHGEALKALELLVKLIVFKQEGERAKILINVGDYREKREEALRLMADRLVQKAIELNQPVMFPWLSPGERRVIHIYLKDNPEVETLSEGEGNQRRLMIKLKEKME